MDRVMEIARGWQIIPEFTFISNFIDHPLFLQAWAEQGEEAMKKEEYDRYLFSYHGLPERQIRKGSVEGYCQLGACCNKYSVPQKHPPAK